MDQNRESPGATGRVDRSGVTFSEVEGELLKIPALSPDLHPIENIFYIVKNSLWEDALKDHTEAESFLQFQQAVMCACKMYYFECTGQNNWCLTNKI